MMQFGVAISLVGWLGVRLQKPCYQCDRGVSGEGIAARTAIHAQLRVVFEASDSFQSYHPNPIYLNLLILSRA